MNRIMVLHGSSRWDPGQDSTASLLASLAYGKRLELQSRPRESRDASLRGIALAVAALQTLHTGRVTADDLRFPQDGKPHVPGAPDFSIAHSSDWVGCAVAEEGIVGFDVETCTTPESSVQLARWTAIEAVLKAAGAGLRYARQVEPDLDSRRGRFAGRDYCLHPVALASHVVAHVATDRAGCNITVRGVDVDERP
jgi:phosphopantetheinyl transferase